MSNEELKAIWQEIAEMAKSDREYINSLPDFTDLNAKLFATANAYLEACKDIF